MDRHRSTCYLVWNSNCTDSLLPIAGLSACVGVGQDYDSIGGYCIRHYITEYWCRAESYARHFLGEHLWERGDLVPKRGRCRQEKRTISWQLTFKIGGFLHHFDVGGWMVPDSHTPTLSEVWTEATRANALRRDSSNGTRSTSPRKTSSCRRATSLRHMSGRTSPAAEIDDTR